MTYTKEEKKAYAKAKNNEGREKWLTTIEEGIRTNEVPWRKPWKANGLCGGIPMNVSSKRVYRGGNVWGLMFRAMAEGWSDLRFGTRKNLADKGYSIKGLKNGTGCPVVFYKPSSYMVENDDGEMEEKRSFMSRWYEVWCVEQCEDYEPPVAENVEAVPEHEMMAHFNTYVTSQAPRLTLLRKGNRACYNSRNDTITLPKHESFTEPLGEVMTAFHEAAHSTGHVTRLERPLGNGFGSSAYAFEELIAEMTSMLTVIQLGGDYEPSLVNEEHANSTAYLKNWLKACDEDSGKALSQAFSEAQKATDFILETLEGNE